MKSQDKGRKGGTLSPGGRLKAAQLIRDLTPSDRVYDRYASRARDWLSGCSRPKLRHDGDVTLLMRPTFVPSTVFARDYLIAWTEAHWWRRHLPHLDAAAMAPCQKHWPPLVLIPEIQSGARAAALIHILEHEFVHINQMLLRRYIMPPLSGRSAKEILRQLYGCMRTEYEAHMVQQTLRPSEVDWPRGWTADEWCVLKGYVSALQEAVLALLSRNVPSLEIAKFVDLWPKSLTSELRRLEIDHAQIAFYYEQWPRHLLLALDDAAARRPDLKSGRAFRLLAKRAGGGASSNGGSG